MSGDKVSSNSGKRRDQLTRGALQVVGGAVPFVGGLFSAVVGAWS